MNSSPDTQPTRPIEHLLKDLSIPDLETSPWFTLALHLGIDPLRLKLAHFEKGITGPRAYLLPILREQGWGYHHDPQFQSLGLMDVSYIFCYPDQDVVFAAIHRLGLSGFKTWLTHTYTSITTQTDVIAMNCCDCPQDASAQKGECRFISNIRNALVEEAYNTLIASRAPRQDQNLTFCHCK